MWLIPEAHLEMADSRLFGGVFLGASFGSGDDRVWRWLAAMHSQGINKFFTNDERMTTNSYPKLVLNPQNKIFRFRGTKERRSAALLPPLWVSTTRKFAWFGSPMHFRTTNNFNVISWERLAWFPCALYPARYLRTIPRRLCSTLGLM